MAIADVSERTKLNKIMYLSQYQSQYVYGCMFFFIQQLWWAWSHTVITFYNNKYIIEMCLSQNYIATI